MEVTFEFSTEGDFDLNIKSASLADGLDLNSPIDSSSPALFNRVYTSGVIDGRVFAGANGPVRVKGHFRNHVKITIPAVGPPVINNTPEVTFTSVEPAEPNRETFVYVGFGQAKAVRLGEVDILTTGSVRF